MIAETLFNAKAGDMVWFKSDTGKWSTIYVEKATRTHIHAKGCRFSRYTGRITSDRNSFARVFGSIEKKNFEYVCTYRHAIANAVEQADITQLKAVAAIVGYVADDTGADT